VTHSRRANDGLLERALEDLPIFPLPGTVFFPNTLLPLHVFEPRYRQMTEHALDGHQHIALVLALPRLEPGLLPSPVPQVARVAGAGRIIHHERLPDGRFHILLQGVARVELHAELPMGDRLYRRVRAQLWQGAEGGNGAPQSDPDVEACARELQTLRNCYARLTDALPGCRETLGDLPLRLDAPGVIGDVVCAAVLEDIALRQQALEETDVRRRLSLANEALATLLLKSLACEETKVN
jgi:Lon protease-like protein